MQDGAWHAALAAVVEIRAGASNTEPTAPARMLHIGPVLILGAVIRSANRTKIQKSDKTDGSPYFASTCSIFKGGTDP